MNKVAKFFGMVSTAVIGAAVIIDAFTLTTAVPWLFLAGVGILSVAVWVDK